MIVRWQAAAVLKWKLICCDGYRSPASLVVRLRGEKGRTKEGWKGKVDLLTEPSITGDMDE